MHAVVQRVSRACVRVQGKTQAEIGAGFLVLLGIARDDTPEGADYLADKVAELRVFEDAEGKMNLPLAAVNGAVLVVSQFTLYGDCRKGRRPSFDRAAPPTQAEALYARFVASLREHGLRVETGVFQARMAVELVNDGPVTLLLSSPAEREQF